MSRPWSSVPSQYGLPVVDEFSPGGSFESITSSCARSYGFWGEIHGAVRAIVTTTTSIARPTRASRLSANSAAKRRQSGCSRAAGAAGSCGVSTAMLISMRGHGAKAHARIEDGVQHVDDEVDRDEDGHDDQQVGHDHRAIELVDRVDEELARARPREDGLGDDRECDHRSQYQADDG